jgi:hypothetical protein
MTATGFDEGGAADVARNIRGWLLESDLLVPAVSALYLDEIVGVGHCAHSVSSNFFDRKQVF